MAGHSRWANIEHRKGVQDARKGRIYTRLIRITLGGDDAGKMWAPLEALEDLDDVQHVYSNAGFPDAFVQQHAAA